MFWAVYKYWSSEWILALKFGLFGLKIYTTCANGGYFYAQTSTVYSVFAPVGCIFGKLIVNGQLLCRLLSMHQQLEHDDKKKKHQTKKK